jgi:hypothetical protein
MAIEVELTGVPPSEPDADFAFYVDFKKGRGSPSRVFAAAQDFIHACERLDRDLVGVVDPGIETVLVLEDIEAGSLKVWLRNVLAATDDDAIKDLDWKKQVGSYLLKAKYILLRWADDPAAPQKLPEVRQEIRQLAADTDVRHLPDYAAPSPETLVRAMTDFQAVKERLGPGDSASLISADGTRYEIDLNIRWNAETLEDLAVKHTLDSPPIAMILAVKKPDYLGASRWSFRHGKKTIEAKIEDEPWLRSFQGRQIDVRPGDALQCMVMIESLYGYDNELLTERYRVLEVKGVLTDRISQTDMFDDETQPGRDG